MPLRRRLALGGLGLLSLTASAQDTVRLGFQQALTAPIGTLRTTEGMPNAVGLGLHGRFTLQPGHVLQPRLDLLATGRVKLRSYNDQGMELSSSQRSVTGISLELDYLYFPDHQPIGWYASLGLGQQRWDSLGSGSSSVASPGSPSSTWVATRWEPSLTLQDPKRLSLLVTLGGGYQFTPRTGLEARFAHSRMGQANVMANTVRLGVTFSF